MQPGTAPEDIESILSRFHSWADQQQAAQVDGDAQDGDGSPDVREIPYEEAIRQYRNRNGAPAPRRAPTPARKASSPPRAESRSKPETTARAQAAPRVAPDPARVTAADLMAALRGAAVSESAVRAPRGARASSAPASAAPDPPAQEDNPPKPRPRRASIVKAVAAEPLQYLPPSAEALPEPEPDPELEPEPDPAPLPPPPEVRARAQTPAPVRPRTPAATRPQAQMPIRPSDTAALQPSPRPAAPRPASSVRSVDPVRAAAGNLRIAATAARTNAAARRQASRRQLQQSRLEEPQSREPRLPQSRRLAQDAQIARVVAPRSLRQVTAKPPILATPGLSPARATSPGTARIPSRSPVRAPARAQVGTEARTPVQKTARGQSRDPIRTPLRTQARGQAKAAPSRRVVAAPAPRPPRPRHPPFHQVLATTVHTPRPPIARQKESTPDRSRRITTRFSPSELRRIEKHADLLGLTVSAYLRQCGLAAIAAVQSAQSVEAAPRAVPPARRNGHGVWQPNPYTPQSPSLLGGWLSLLRNRFLGPPVRFSEDA